MSEHRPGYRDTASTLLRGADLDAPLLDALGVLHYAPQPEGHAFDPSALIRAVRVLWHLGAADAMQVMRSYTEVAESKEASPLEPAPEKVLLVARLLFAPRAEPVPPIVLGKPDVAVPDGDTAPLMVAHDVPFLPVGAYHLGGLRGSIQRDLDWYEEHATLAATALQPQTSPLSAVEELVATPRWGQIPGEQRAYARSLVYRQALRAMLETGRVPSGAVEIITTASAEDLDRRWHEVATPSLRQAAWDDARMAFVVTRP